jgi:hypothetical protein
MQVKFVEGEDLHNMAFSGKNACCIIGNSTALNAQGWCLLFQELYQEATNLVLSPKGAKLCIFGIRLALTPTRNIFMGLTGLNKMVKL